MSNKMKPFALISETKPGTRLIADAGFDCIPADRIVIVEGPEGSIDPDKIWVPCKEGKHYLNGQVSDDEKEYVGLYPVIESKP